jgi:hypothetical protein
MVVDQDALVYDVGAGEHRLLGLVRRVRPLRQEAWVGNLHDPPAFASEVFKLEMLVSLAFCCEEIGFGAAARRDDAAIGDFEIEMRQILALEEVIQVRRREDDNVSDPLHSSPRQTAARTRQDKA